MCGELVLVVLKSDIVNGIGGIHGREREKEGRVGRRNGGIEGGRKGGKEEERK